MFCFFVSFGWGRVIGMLSSVSLDQFHIVAICSFNRYANWDTVSFGQNAPFCS